MSRLPIILAGFFLAVSPALAACPSFDCSKARAPDELAICGDAELSQLDRLAALAYDEARQASGRASARATARDGLASRSGCGSGKACIMSVQVATIIKFQQLGATVSLPEWALTATGDGADSGGDSDQAGDGALPTEIGQCVNTAIAEITSRFEADINANPDDGSAVNFDNGGHQVSYEKEPPLINSRVGDPVLMCLVEIPQDCPPGDDRGRIYTTTNLRTQESWTLPDFAAFLRRSMKRVRGRPNRHLYMLWMTHDTGRTHREGSRRAVSAGA